VHPADIQDRDGGIILLCTLFGQFPFLEWLFADSAYAAPIFHQALANLLPQLKAEIVRRSDRANGFVVFAGSSNVPAAGDVISCSQRGIELDCGQGCGGRRSAVALRTVGRLGCHRLEFCGMSFARSHLQEARRIIDELDVDVIDRMADIIATARATGGLFFLGVGGSDGNCSHAVNNFRKIVGVESYAPPTMSPSSRRAPMTRVGKPSSSSGSRSAG
jgi:SIS domain